MASLLASSLACVLVLTSSSDCGRTSVAAGDPHPHTDPSATPVTAEGREAPVRRGPSSSRNATSASPGGTGEDGATDVVIVNSGSTNALGYRIDVPRSGPLRYECGDDRSTATVPGDLVSKLYADVAQASPLSRLPVARCAKSVSFGTRTYVQVGDDRSPDVSCGRDDTARALYTDATRIANELHLTLRRPRGRGR